MPFNVNQFRTQLVGDGARPNLFEVTLNFPNIVAGGALARAKSTFLVRAAQLPGSTVGMVGLYYFGREVKVPGNRTFADWTVTVINDEDFSIRNSLEEWFRAINDNVQNVRNPGAVNFNQYSTDVIVRQYGKDGSGKKAYKFVGMFPVDISAIDLDWGTNDAIEEYTVNFQYQYWESAQGVG